MGSVLSKDDLAMEFAALQKQDSDVTISAVCAWVEKQPVKNFSVSESPKAVKSADFEKASTEKLKAKEPTPRSNENLDGLDGVEIPDASGGLEGVEMPDGLDGVEMPDASAGLEGVEMPDA